MPSSAATGANLRRWWTQGPSRFSAAKCSGTRIAHVALEAVARMRGAEPQPISRSRVTLATIEAAAIESTSASPLITALHSQSTVDAVDAVDEHELRRAPAAPSRRAPAPRARRRGCCRGRCAPAARSRPRPARWRRSSRKAPRASSAFSFLESLSPRGMRFGIEDDRGGDHRTGERPPARLVAARDREHAALHRGAFAREGRADLVRIAERQAWGANSCARSCADREGNSIAADRACEGRGKWRRYWNTASSLCPSGSRTNAA